MKRGTRLVALAALLACWMAGWAAAPARAFPTCPTCVLIGVLGSEIDALVLSGALDAGQGKALNATLDAAADAQARGNTTAALNALGAFLNQVNAFIQSGVLTQEEGSALIDLADAAIALLVGGLP